MGSDHWGVARRAVKRSLDEVNAAADDLGINFTVADEWTRSESYWVLNLNGVRYATARIIPGKWVYVEGGRARWDPPPDLSTWRDLIAAAWDLVDDHHWIEKRQKKAGPSLSNEAAQAEVGPGSVGPAQGESHD